MPVIEVDHLTKVYRTALRAPGLLGALKGLFAHERKEIVAVRDLSFATEPDQFVECIGPNGAGGIAYGWWRFGVRHYQSTGS